MHHFTTQLSFRLVLVPNSINYATEAIFCLLLNNYLELYYKLNFFLLLSFLVWNSLVLFYNYCSIRHYGFSLTTLPFIFIIIVNIYGCVVIIHKSLAALFTNVYSNIQIFSLFLFYRWKRQDSVIWKKCQGVKKRLKKKYWMPSLIYSISNKSVLFCQFC